MPLRHDNPGSQHVGSSALPAVLQEILDRGAVRRGDEWIPLHSHVSARDGVFLQELVQAAHATRSLEVGMAYGISTMFLCHALVAVSPNPRHVVIDPFQRSDWDNIGLKNTVEARFDRFIEFHEARSEFVLPALAAANREFDLALIDGWHSFDQALVEFYYIDRMLRVGGLVAFDDADWPGIHKLLRFLITLPAYEVFRPERGSLQPTLVGKLRRRLADSKPGRATLHPSFRRRSWDLGLQQRCVALRKVAENKRDMRAFEDF